MNVTLNTVSSNTAPQQPAPVVPVVSPTAAGTLSSQAASLSAQSAVVASLGGSSGAAVYTPAGLFNTLQQAGMVKEPVSVPEQGSNVDTTNAAQYALEQGVVATLGGQASASGIYTGGGTVTSGLSEQASANWADLLKTNPNLAGTVISSSFDFGIVSTLQVTA